MHRGPYARTGRTLAFVAAGLLLAACSSTPAPNNGTETGQPAGIAAQAEPATEMVQIECFGTDGQPTRTYDVARTETPDFSAAWADGDNATCTVLAELAPTTPAEKDAVAVTGNSNANAIYGQCAGADPDAIYVRSDWAATTEGAPTMKAMLAFCPDHPHAEQLRASLERGGLA